jgi:hypothetical protein
VIMLHVEKGSAFFPGPASPWTFRDADPAGILESLFPSVSLAHLLRQFRSVVQM